MFRGSLPVFIIHASPKPHTPLIRRPARVFASEPPVGTRIRGRDVPWWVSKGSDPFLSHAKVRFAA